jgi:hypothetical protein
VLGDQLNGVVAVSAASAWAPGTTNRITLHLICWDGKSWQPVPTLAWHGNRGRLTIRE